MRLASAAVVTLAVAVLDVLGGCRPTPTEGRAAPPDAVTAGPADAQDTVIAARCRKTDVAFALDDGHGLADLEVGDAIAYPGGYAVGLVHHAAAGRVAAVALLRRDPIGLVRVLDLGPTIGDAPPPRIGWREGELVAAAYARPSDSRAAPPEAGAPALREDATRDVALYAIAPDASAAPALSVPQRRDDSFALDLAFDGATGLLVWDEATNAPRGVVKASVFTRDHVSASRDVSPSDSDAELPRVVARGGGFAVVWIARRPDPGSGLDGSPNEATGEARAYGWLEMVTVDAQGQPSGPTRRLTPVTGHVSAYDIAALEPAQATARAAPSFLLVARDDGEAVDGSGGTLVRVRVTGEAADPPVVVATQGLGRGAPSFVSRSDTRGAPPGPGSAALALVWVGKDEQGRLLPIDVATGAPTASPSAEDAFDDARALLFTGAAPSAASSDVLAATPSDSAAQLRVFACAR